MSLRREKLRTWASVCPMAPAAGSSSSRYPTAGWVILGKSGDMTRKEPMPRRCTVSSASIRLAALWEQIADSLASCSSRGKDDSALAVLVRNETGSLENRQQSPKRMGKTSRVHRGAAVDPPGALSQVKVA